MVLIIGILLPTVMASYEDKLVLMDKPQFFRLLQFLNLNDIVNFRTLSQKLKRKYEDVSRPFVQYKKEFLDQINLQQTKIIYLPLDVKNFDENTKHTIYLPIFITQVTQLFNQRLILREDNQDTFEKKIDKKFSTDNIKEQLNNFLDSLDYHAVLSPHMFQILNTFNKDKIQFQVFVDRFHLLCFDKVCVAWVNVPEYNNLVPLVWALGDAFFFKLKSDNTFLGMYSKQRDIAILYSLHSTQISHSTHGNRIKAKFFSVKTTELRNQIQNNNLDLDVDLLENFDMDIIRISSDTGVTVALQDLSNGNLDIISYL
jgi:hypothetical protein